MDASRLERAARALLEQLGNSVPHADFEIEDLRAALALPLPAPRADAYVEWCARHANIEKVPGPFCPACAYASVMRDGVKMGRESAPRAVAHALRGAGSEAAWTDGCALIAAERKRQVEKEGWTHEHDDEHADGALRMAAAFLAAEGTDAEVTMPDYEASWIEVLVKKHGKDRVRSLVIAGALIAAEIDRLLRASATGKVGA